MGELEKCIRYIASTLLLAGCLVMMIFVCIVCLPPNVFSGSYENVLQAKYDNLVKIKEPKIIICGGSSAAFGIDEALLEEETGYKVVNMGVHAGMGRLFMTEIVKRHINEGDIILLGYEYEWGKDSFNKLNINTIMQGVDSDLEILADIPVKNWSEVLGYLPTFAEEKAYQMNHKQPQGTYSRSSFDENGVMILQRPEVIYKEEKFGKVEESDLYIEDASVQYLTDLKEYVEEMGASIYFIAPPLYSESYVGDKQKLVEMVEKEEEMIGISYISNPIDYLFPLEYMFDTQYHCNDQGEKYRTELLVQDLAGIL